MSLSYARRSAVAAVAVLMPLAVMSAGSSPATAAQPEEGKYRYYVPDPETPGAVKDGIFFDVREVRGKKAVSGAVWVSDVCGRMTIQVSLPVNAKGKATYKGQATRAGGTPVKVKLKLKFTKPTKAKVTVKDKDPSVDCGAIKNKKAKKY